MMLMLGTINLIQIIVMYLLVGGVLGLSGYALWHALTTPEIAFTSEGKRTRTFWALLNGLAVAVSFLGLTPTGIVGVMTVLMALIIPGVYLADVRPAVAAYRRRGRNGGNPGGSGYGSSRTPW